MQGRYLRIGSLLVAMVMGAFFISFFTGSPIEAQEGKQDLEEKYFILAEKLAQSEKTAGIRFISIEKRLKQAEDCIERFEAKFKAIDKPRMSKEIVKKVFAEFYAHNFEALKSKSEWDSEAAWKHATSSHGFASRRAFEIACGLWDADKTVEIANETAKEYTAMVMKWNEEQDQKEAQEGK